MSRVLRDGLINGFWVSDDGFYNWVKFEKLGIACIGAAEGLARLSLNFTPVLNAFEETIAYGQSHPD